MIDLRSDTVTTPSDAMREAARDADVGDDVYGEDPTVNRLEERAAEILDTDDALYCPTGTMANQVAARVLTEPGQEVICERRSHVYNYEVGGLVDHAGLQTRPIDGGERGAVDPDAVADAIRTEDLHTAGTGLLCLENTHNVAGGRALSPDAIDEPARVAREHGVAVHLDGARLFNAAVAHDVPAARFTRHVDTVMVSCSKGLGAPVGSLLAGDEGTIAAARRACKLHGGGWRQAGIVAAPALHALENREHLAADHRRAERLAEGLRSVEGLDPADPETNILMVETAEPAADVAAAWKRRDVLASAMAEYRIRLCTHRDVSDADVEEAIERVAAV